MEEFFEAEAVFCLGRNDADEDNMFWDNLLQDKDDDHAESNVRLPEETVSRGCEEEMEWFDSLLIEEEVEKPKDNDTYEFAELLEKKAPETATEKKIRDSKVGEEEIPKVELKELPSHLKYVFLGENNTFPMIIVVDLKDAVRIKNRNGFKIYTCKCTRSAVNKGQVNHKVGLKDK